MVGIFAGLKWRLVTSRLRATHGATRAWVVVGLVVATLAVLAIAVGLASLRTVPEVATTLVVTLFSVQLIAWVLTPLLAFGVDETVDPARFALLPLRGPTLQRGLLVSSLIGYLPAANMIVLLGAAIGVSVPWSVLPVALVCAAAQLVLCLLLTRAASTAMSGLMTSRRGRDLGMLVGFVVFVLYMAFAWAMNAGEGRGLEAGITSLAGVLAWTPPGALAVLPSLVASGEWIRAEFAVAIALVGLALSWWWWSVALRRSLTTTPSMTEGSAPAGRLGKDTSVATGVSGTMRVVAGRDRLLIWRDPMRRLPWLILVVLAIAWPLIVFQGEGAIFGVALAAIFIGAQSGNVYGIEGSGLWLHLQTITDRIKARGEVLGHAVAALIPGTLVIVIALGVLAVIRGGYQQLPAAAGVCVAAMLGGTAAASYLSAAMPYALPQSRKSLFASGVPGQKGRTAGASLSMVGGAIVVAVPAVGAAVLSILVSPGWGWVGLVVGVAAGAGALWWASYRTADLYLERAPEILAVVAAGDRV